MKRKEMWIIRMLVSAGLFIGGLGTLEAAPVPTGELRFAIESVGTETIDPVLTSTSSKPMFTPFYDWLIGVKPDGSLSAKTGVATDWKLSPDAMTLTVHLRPGIRFHNGDELTSADVKFSLEQFTSKRCVSTNAGYLRSVIKNIETPDPLTVVIHYKKPSGVLANFLSRQLGQEGMVLPKKYIEEKGLAYFGAHPVGSGPYKFVEQRTGTHIKYEAVDYPHWLVGVPRFKYFTIYVIKEENTRIAMLKTGAVDIVTISRDKAKEVPGFKVYEKKGAVTVGVHANYQWDTTTYLGNEKFREALALAINREEIRDFIFGGKGVMSGSGAIYGSWALGYKPVPLVPYDPERARQLVKETFPGEVPFINIYSYNQGGVPELATIAEALAGYWEKIGVKSKIIPTEYSSYRKEWSTKGPNMRNSVGMQSAPNRLLWGGLWNTIFQSKGLLALTHDPKLDALLAAFATELDPDMIGQRQYDVASYVREHYAEIPTLECSVLLAADPKKVPEWPNISIPCAADYFIEDLYAR